MDWNGRFTAGPGLYNGFGELICEIIPEQEARKRCDSDRLEREHKAATAEHRRAVARAARERRKLFERAKRVTVAGFHSWTGNAEHNGKQLTHAQFSKFLAKLDGWSQRRIKLASMEATAAKERGQHA